MAATHDFRLWQAVRKYVLASTKARIQREKEWRAAKNADRLRPITDMVASIHAAVAICDKQILRLDEVEKWRKYNKRVLKRNKREGIAIYERTDLAVNLIMDALPADDRRSATLSHVCNKYDGVAISMGANSHFKRVRIAGP